MTTRQGATRSEYGPIRRCELCGVEVYQYAGPRVARPLFFESETGLQHSPRCTGITDWVEAQLRELALPAWEQPGYHKPAPQPAPKQEQRPTPPTKQNDQGVIAL